jgi:hypothetical protein
MRSAHGAARHPDDILHGFGIQSTLLMVDSGEDGGLDIDKSGGSDY